MQDVFPLFSPLCYIFFNSIILNYLKQNLLEIIPARPYCKYILYVPQRIQDRLLEFWSWKSHSRTPSLDRAQRRGRGQ